MFRRSATRAFRSQHTTPVIPQCRVAYDGPKAIRVGYVLYRPQVVKHAPHPIEQEYAFVLDREHQRYGRHPGTESASHYFIAKGMSLDTWGRTDPKQVQDNFFNMPLYQDALQATVSRFEPQPRLAAADFTDPAAPEVPQRHTLKRALADFLFLIVRDAATGKWTVPSTARAAEESLRSTADRALGEHHQMALSAFLWSNAPQAVLRGPEAQHGPEQPEEQLYLYSAAYLSGRPDFAGIAPACDDHAWVTRAELCDYDFVDERMLPALLDITPDGSFTAPATGTQ